MFGLYGAKRGDARTFLARLRRDVRGNTLAMMAIALIPICGLVGSGVDTARLYVVKARLQQACDAGVLAGRKFMDDSSATLDANATSQAQKFFTNNFTTGWMTTNTVSFTPVKANGAEVNGTANATVPMTIMKMFGAADVTLSVTCTARYDVADTDIMFVLDTTGSMACLPGGPDSCGTGTRTYTRPSTSYPGTGTIDPPAMIDGAVPGYAGSPAIATNELTSGGVNVSRIDALRQAVLDFYDTFKANADPSTHIRYGFVTYSSSVNVGQAILGVSSSYMVGANGSSDTPYYQTRRIIADHIASIASETANGKTQANCTAAAVRSPSTALTYNTSNGRATSTYDEWVKTSMFNSTMICKTRVDNLEPQWQYARYPVDVSPLISGSTTMNDPTKVTGDKLLWAGCIETPVDSPGQTSFTTSNLPSELNPDLKPSGSTRWWPHLQDVEYSRSSTPETGYGEDHIDFGSGSQLSGGYVACGKPAKRLGVMTRSQVSDFVHATDFVPEGGTYHDVGMIWGARLISPAGAWAADTTAWPGRNPPNRVIVFMTDGVMSPNSNSYSMYGYEDMDKRVSNGSTGIYSLTDYHNFRFLAACAAAKTRNIDIWTVEIASSTSTPMKNCATSSSQALSTTTGTGLSDAFKGIAQRLAMLRLTH
jgi:Flp pilus assembly protein TadG